MSWRERTSWIRYGSYGLVLLLTFSAVQYGAVTNDYRYLTLRSVAAVLCGLALLVRRRYWFLAPLLATVSTGLWGWPLLPLLLMSLFDLSAHRRGAVAMGCGAVVLVAEALLSSATDSFTLRFSLLLLLVVGCGQWAGDHRRVKALSAEVEHLRIERELREEAARAAERSRIATEMHDVLAHRLSLIALHTGVLTARSGAAAGSRAGFRAGSGSGSDAESESGSDASSGSLPETVAQRLTLLRTASTEALADLRDILGALHGPRPTPEEAAAVPAPAPAPVLRDVRELVDEARSVGERIELNVEGRPGQAPTVHRLAVYRLVQEALTNARKHAEGAAVTVRIDHGPPVTVVEVTNAPGAAATDATGSGFGLVGLRERVTALGGRLHAGPHGEGAWRLAARIPYSADSVGPPDSAGSPRSGEPGRSAGSEQNGVRT